MPSLIPKAVFGHAAGLRLSEEDGWLIVEIMIGAVVLVLGALAIYSGLDGASKTSGKNRNRSVASYLAQQDQERMRSMDATALSNYSRTATIKVAGVPYKVRSTASFVSDTSGAVSCTNSSTTAQYLKITSSVADPSNQNKPVVEDSLLSPKPADGGAAVQIIDRNGNGVSGIPVSLAEPPGSTGTTDSQGCVIFGFLDTGTTYGVSFSQPGYVDPSGTNQITNSPTSQVPGTTTLTQFQYDLAGSVPVKFVDSSGNAARGYKVTFFNTHIPQTPSSVVKDAGGQSTYTASNLFPFADPYTVYAGSCTADNPGSGAPTVTVPPGGASSTLTVTEPSINLKVVDGSTTKAGLNVVLKDTGCGDSYQDTTTSAGALSNPGYPYGIYSICADDGSRYAKTSTDVANTSASGTSTVTLTIPTSGWWGRGTC